jgi:tRNA 2-thiouridine synthesizing protein A
MTSLTCDSGMAPDGTVIDARGSFCPGPLMELIAVLKYARVGDALVVLSTDAGSAREIPEWLRKVGQQHVRTSEHDGVWCIALRKVK